MNASVNQLERIEINLNPLLFNEEVGKFLAPKGKVVLSGLLSAILNTSKYMSGNPGEAIRVLIDRILHECESDKAYRKSMLNRLSMLPFTEEIPDVGKAKTRITNSINRGVNILRIVDGSTSFILELVDGSSSGIRTAS
ncbi:MAG: hypothetical protein N4A44_00895 [Alphaproteobacteria bacterium]|jgi:hypothetical protein|nr:hypothetical protein [Alphaproteobacteria bacterium]